MPFVSIDHAPGLSDADRRQLQTRLADVVMKSFNAPPASVRVYTRTFDPATTYVADGDHESGLPVIRVEFLPGRNQEQKRALVHGLAHAAAEVLAVPVDRVRTILYEKERTDWARGDTMVADAQ